MLINTKHILYWTTNWLFFLHWIWLNRCFSLTKGEHFCSQQAKMNGLNAVRSLRVWIWRSLRFYFLETSIIEIQFGRRGGQLWHVWETVRGNSGHIHQWHLRCKHTQRSLKRSFSAVCASVHCAFYHCNQPKTWAHSQPAGQLSPH